MQPLHIQTVITRLVALCAIGLPFHLHASDISLLSENAVTAVAAGMATIETSNAPVAARPDAEAVSASAPGTSSSIPADTLSNAVRIEPAGIANTMMSFDLSGKLPEATEMDIWERIRSGFSIPDLDNPLVNKQRASYARHPEYFLRITTRASLYLYHVVEELEKRNMPTELALLPFVESAFNPQAYSSAKAAGMWQFIPSTGRVYNLKQNVFRDERRDVIASTDAALSYLQKLYGMFGDWQLALAAYNWGEGSVQRAINRNRAAGKPTDFNSLSVHMPAETRNYVPKLQAVKMIIAAPEQYAIALPKVDNEPYFVTIGKTRDIDIKVAAQLAEISIDEFKALNPQFNRPVIIGGANTQILLPESNAEKFKHNLSKWGRALSSWTIHKVTSTREKIDAIAKRFNTTPAVIREANNIPPKMYVMAGSTIVVPKTVDSPEKDIAPGVADNAVLAMGSDHRLKSVSIKVRRGDNLTSIARRHRVSVSQIKSWNNLKSDKVAAGKRLRLEVPYRVVQGKSKNKITRSKASKRTKAATQKSARKKTRVATSKRSSRTSATGKGPRASVSFATTK